jgi:SAM-dependent methyltransferase
VNILDVGCGAGDNARSIRETHTEARIFGITLSPAEARIARQYMIDCWTADIERDLPEEIRDMKFDALVFSHVLEHVRDPAGVLAHYLTLLRDGGEVLIAVPNVLSWRYRLLFVRGRFEYETTGTLDETHLRFFTFDSADRLLFRLAPELRIIAKTAVGSVPLWFLRRHIFPKRVSGWIDRTGCRYFPNLFGGQILIKAVHRKI